MKKILSLVLLLPCVFIACDDDDDDGPDVNKGNILISSRLPTPDGTSGTTYTQLIDSINPATYDNYDSYETSYATPVVIIGDYVYDLPGYNNDKDEVRKYLHSNGSLQLVGTYVCPANSRTVCLVAKGDKGYLSMHGLGIIHVIDLSTMKFIKSIDLTSFDESGDGNPDPSIMVIRDNLLYVGLTQNTATGLVPADRAKADVLIIDTGTDAVVKEITDDRGFSSPTNYMEGNLNSIFVDDNNDIYVNCIGGRGYLSGHKVGLIRIKSGETEFDPDYSLSLNDMTIDGIEYPLDRLFDMVYSGNGKYYASASSRYYYSYPADYLADKVVMSLEIDIWNKSVKKLELPRGNIFATCVGQYEDFIIFGLATEDGEGFYTYNPATETCSEKPVINTTGYPFSFQVFE
jgi:hypothetical protein